MGRKNPSSDYGSPEGRKAASDAIKEHLLAAEVVGGPENPQQLDLFEDAYREGIDASHRIPPDQRDLGRRWTEAIRDVHGI